MIVYKLTCSSGNVYYGSSSKTLAVRANKGWYHCACKDFDIIKMEVIEEVEDKEKALERESYYIENFPCVNKQTAKQTKEWRDKKKKLYYKKNIDKVKEVAKKHAEKVKIEKRYYCELCDTTFKGNKALQIHVGGHYHKLKEKCKEELGEDWRSHYRLWKGRRHEETRKKKKMVVKYLKG